MFEDSSLITCLVELEYSIVGGLAEEEEHSGVDIHHNLGDVFHIDKSVVFVS